MIGSYARRTRDADYPWAPTAEDREAFCHEILSHWGGPVGLEDRAPSMAGDPEFRDWWATYLRMGASPGAAVALTRMNAAIDIAARPADDSRADAGAPSHRRSVPARRGGPLRRQPASPAHDSSNCPATITCRLSATSRRS